MKLQHETVVRDKRFAKSSASEQKPFFMKKTRLNSNLRKKRIEKDIKKTVVNGA